MTDLSGYEESGDWLSGDIRAITQVVQGLLVHDAWVRRYGTNLDG